MIVEWSDALRIVVAAAAGGLVGIERELHDKPAGLRTNVLICVGAAVFTLLSLRMAGTPADPTRIAAQIVTGIGFLGAGAIMRHGLQITGMTTAATIWVIASLGMAFGAGQYFIGIVATLLVHASLVGLSFVETALGRMYTSARFEMRVEGTATVEAIRDRIRDLRLRPRSWSLGKEAGIVSLDVEVIGRERRINQLHGELVDDTRVQSLRRA